MSPRAWAVVTVQLAALSWVAVLGEYSMVVWLESLR